MTEKPRILVIDDDENIRKTISITLTRGGFHVDTAETGKQAIEKAKVSFYNVALIDVRLPDMDGNELLTALARTTPKMIKIILTGHPSLGNAVGAINKGVDAYLVKPVDTKELMILIKQHLARQKEEKEFNEDKLAEFIETRFKELQTHELRT